MRNEHTENNSNGEQMDREINEPSQKQISMEPNIEAKIEMSERK